LDTKKEMIRQAELEKRVTEKIMDLVKAKPSTRPELETATGQSGIAAGKLVKKFLDEHIKELNVTGRGVKGDPKLYSYGGQENKK
jgi:hypothetical protein